MANGGFVIKGGVLTKYVLTTVVRCTDCDAPIK